MAGGEHGYAFLQAGPYGDGVTRTSDGLHEVVCKDPLHGPTAAALDLLLAQAAQRMQGHTG